MVQMCFWRPSKIWAEFMYYMQAWTWETAWNETNSLAKQKLNRNTEGDVEDSSEQGRLGDLIHHCIFHRQSSTVLIKNCEDIVYKQDTLKLPTVDVLKKSCNLMLMTITTWDARAINTYNRFHQWCHLSLREDHYQFTAYRKVCEQLGVMLLS